MRFNYTIALLFMTFLKKIYIFPTSMYPWKNKSKRSIKPYIWKKLRGAIRRRSQLDSKNFKKWTKENRSLYKKQQNFCRKIYKKEKNQYYYFLYIVKVIWLINWLMNWSNSYFIIYLGKNCWKLCNVSSQVLINISPCFICLPKND